MVSIIGEGSFHQLHGGVSTNQAEADERTQQDPWLPRALRATSGAVASAARENRSITSAASSRRRLVGSRPRRLTVDIFGEAAPTPEPDGLPTSPVPIPEDLRSGFIEAVWRSLAWKRTDLAGPSHRERTDRPRRVPASDRFRASGLDRRDRHTRRRRTLFLASICDLLDHGQIVSIGEDLSEGLPLHARITYLEGVADDEATLTRVRSLVDPSSSTLVVLGDRVHAQATRRIFAAYAPLVSVGSYLIVTDTIVNGNPVWTGFGPGPNEALKFLLQRHGEFFADPRVGAFRADIQSRRLPETHPMKIFCIGLNKTGTRSLSDALEILGYRSLHWGGSDQATALRRGPEIRVAVERALEEGRPLLEDIDDVDAYSDLLALSTNFDVLDRQYPGSKFILTVRDLDEWLDSRRRHVETNIERRAWRVRRHLSRRRLPDLDVRTSRARCAGSRVLCGPSERPAGHRHLRGRRMGDPLSVPWRARSGRSLPAPRLTEPMAGIRP